MSTRIKASAEPNMNLANSFAKCVLPTPVGPRNMKVPIGRLGSFKPIRLLRMAFTRVSIALSWPITLPIKSSFIPMRRIPSVCAIFCTGMPEIMDTTFAICSSSTVSLFSRRLFSQFSFMMSSWVLNSFSLSRKLAASSKFWSLTASFLRFFISSICFSCSSISFGTEILIRCTREPASSRASMALSGKNRSVMYLSANLTHASRAASV